jgi:hypothetical protein
MIHEAVGSHCGDRTRGSIHPSVLVQVQKVANGEGNVVPDPRISA